MKVVSWYCTPYRRRSSFLQFFATPYLSLRSMRYKRPTNRRSHIFNFLSFGLLAIINLLFAHQLLFPISSAKILLLAPAIYFITESIGAFGQLIFSWSNKGTISIHAQPIFSNNLEQFWGKHWNIWVQDWLKDIAMVWSGKSSTRMLISFLASGLFHEIMFNLPYWLYYQRSYFGTMMSYFLMQFISLWLDKKIMRRFSPVVQRCYLWLIVILPSALFINAPLLKFLGLDYE